MSIKTTEEIIQDIQSYIEPTWGNTPLIDPKQYISDPLVQTQVPAAVGLSRLYQRLEAWTGGLSPLTAEGERLSVVAAIMGMPRMTGLPSLAPIVIKGKSGTILPGGTILLDKHGAEWETLKSVAVGSDGLAYVNAQSPVGAYDLENGELRLETDVDGIDRATNSAQPELGGVNESDEHLRRRLLGVRPHWRVKNTTNSILASVLDVDGVVRAGYTDYPCDSDCPKKMITVIGGDDCEIAQAIYNSAPFSADCCLAGDSSCEINCVDVPFQRMCPVIINVRVWRCCTCATQTDDQALEAIVANAQRIALTRNGLKACDVTSPTDLFCKAEFCVERMPIVPCPDDQENGAEVIIDPAAGAELQWGTTNNSGVCFGRPDCECDEWAQTVNLQPYEYPILLKDRITIIEGCPNLSGGECGC